MILRKQIQQFYGKIDFSKNKIEKKELTKAIYCANLTGFLHFLTALNNTYSFLFINIVRWSVQNNFISWKWWRKKRLNTASKLVLAILFPNLHFLFIKKDKLICVLKKYKKGTDTDWLVAWTQFKSRWTFSTEISWECRGVGL